MADVERALAEEYEEVGDGPRPAAVTRRQGAVLMIRQIKVECVACVNYVRTDPATVEDTLEMYLRVGAPLPSYDEHGVIELGTCARTASSGGRRTTSTSARTPTPGRPSRTGHPRSDGGARSRRTTRSKGRPRGRVFRLGLAAQRRRRLRAARGGDAGRHAAGAADRKAGASSPRPAEVVLTRVPNAEGGAALQAKPRPSAPNNDRNDRWKS